jgi:acetyltransferase
MSTRLLKHLFHPQIINCWAPQDALISDVTRVVTWITDNPAGKRVVQWLDSLPPDSAVDGLWIVFATEDALIEALDTLIAKKPPVILIAQIGAQRSTRELRRQLRSRYASRSSRIVGPDAAHWLVQQGRLSLPVPEWPPQDVAPVRPGHIAILTQSPSIGSCLLDWVRGRQIGLSHFLCVGGSIDVNIADLVDMLVQESSCHAIVIQIDRLRIPARFISALRSCTRYKPVMVLHTGRVRDFQTEQDPENAELLDRELLYRAAIERAGASALDTLDDCFQALESLTKRKPHEGRHLTILGPGDGLEALAADHLYAEDSTRQSVMIRKEPSWFISPEAFPIDEETIATVREQTDGVLIPLVAEHLIAGDEDRFSEWTARFLAFETRLNRPVFFAAPGMVLGRALRLAFDAQGLAVYGSPEQALSGFLALSRHDHAIRLVDASVLPDDPDTLRPAERLLHHLRAQIPLDVALVDRTMILHTIPGCSNHARPGLGAIRLTAGIVRDPVFGPVIVIHEPLGHFPTLAVTLPPLNQALSEDLLHRSVQGRVIESLSLDGFTQAASILTHFSRLLGRVPEIAEVRLQIALEGAHLSVHLDRLRLDHAVAQAIVPYPEQLDREVVLRDGRKARLRPLRPEDEEAHIRFLAKLSRATLRFRYFSDKRSFSARELAAMTHMDYAREIAQIVQVQESHGPETLGVIRSIFDADGLACEFAMVVRDDLQRTGVGQLLLEAAVEIAQQRGSRLIYGETMIENRGMQALSRKIGFQNRIDLDADCVWMTRVLSAPVDAWETERLAQLVPGFNWVVV